MISAVDHLAILWFIMYEMITILEPAASKIYAQAYERRKQENVFARMLGSLFFIFSTILILINGRVSPRRDVQDALHGFLCMSAFGTYNGGDLFLPALKIRLRYSPSNIILFKAALIQHCMLPFKGTGISVSSLKLHMLTLL
ncbi:hypothetical protein JCM5296_001253 [Sporobolomyces johnsonii]